MSTVAAIDKLDAMIRKRIAPLTPYQATVISLSSGQVTIQRQGDTSNQNRLCKRAAGFNLAVNDQVMCLDLLGTPVVLAKLQSAAPSGYALDADLTVPNFLRYGGGGAATITPLSAAGTTGAINSVSGGAFSGDFNLVPGGTGIAAGAQIQIAFGLTLANTNYRGKLFPRNANASGVAWYMGTRATTSCGFNFNVAPTTGLTYAFGFEIEGT